MTDENFTFPQVPNHDQYFRPLSLDQDFMNYGVDDLLYGFMVYHTIYDNNEEEYYLTERRWNSIRPLFCRGLHITPRTCTNHLNKLIQRKLIIRNEDRKRYIFPHNGLRRYQNINNAMIYYLVITSNMSIIKIYIYLLNKWLWKTQKESEPIYDFTLKELREALGYSGSNNPGADDALRTILFSMAKQGIIDAYPTWGQIKEGTTSPVYRLTFVAQHPLEFKTIPTDRAIELTKPRTVQKLEAN